MARKSKTLAGIGQHSQLTSQNYVTYTVRALKESNVDDSNAPKSSAPTHIPIPASVAAHPRVQSFYDRCESAGGWNQLKQEIRSNC